MPKYSTGGSSGNAGGDTCELCGEASDDLKLASVAGAKLEVCPDCRPYDDAGHKDKKKKSKESRRDDDEPSRRKRAAQNAAKASGAWDDDPSRWEKEGTGYDDDQLPYLVRGYGEMVETARQEAGLQREELAEELAVDEADILAVEQGRATQANVGGSLIQALEEKLDLDLTE